MPETTGSPDAKTVELQIERFIHSADPQMSGMRGTSVTAETGYQAFLFSSHFPTVFVSDNGTVEMSESELRVPADLAIEWLRAVANHIEARRDAS